MSDHDGDWDLEADVVVLGSGGAALVAALSAHDYGAGQVVILEKSGMVGGTTAMSGGMLWIPLNHHAQEAGVEDSIGRRRRVPRRARSRPARCRRVVGLPRIRSRDDPLPGRQDPGAAESFTDFPDYQSRRSGRRATAAVRSTTRCSRSRSSVRGHPGEPAEDRHSEAAEPDRGPPRRGEREELAERNDGLPRPGPGADRLAAKGRPRPRHPGPLRDAGPPAVHGGQAGRRRDRRARAGLAASPSPQRRDHRHRRVRVEQTPRADVPARSDDRSGQRARVRGRRADDGDGGRRQPRQHGERLVDGVDQGVEGRQPRRPRQLPALPGRAHVSAVRSW